jgi:rhodanese-related sulfurtransferase
MAVPEIDTDELARLDPATVALIDVRRADEFTEFRVPGARLIPLDELIERIDEVPSDVRVYVICATGNRSGRAVEYLNGQGYDTVNVAGGSKAWRQAGHPVETGPA